MKLLGGTLLMIYRKSDELVDLVTTSRTVLSSFAKAKTAKLGTGGRRLHT